MHLDLPIDIAHRPYWQHGIGEHSSQSNKIIGSVLIDLEADQENTIRIRHLVIQGSSQWIIGRYSTKNCNILRMNGSQMQLPTLTSSRKHMSICPVNYDLHCYIPLSVFGIKSN